MHSYVTPGNDAPRGVRKRGLSKGKAGSVREQVESWKVRGKVGRVGNLAKSRGSLWVWYGWMVVVDFCALGGRCARRDWHTGKRKGEGEGGEAKILGFGPWSLVLLQDPAARRATVDGHVRGRNGPDAAKIRQCGQGSRFWRAFLATFARHW